MKLILIAAICVASVCATQVSNIYYTACDQTEACGVPYNFVDISGTGTKLYGGPGTPTGHTAGGSTVTLAQPFSLFGGSYTSAIVGYAGFITLTPPILNVADNFFFGPIDGFTPAHTIPVLTAAYGYNSNDYGAWHQYFAGGAGPFVNPTEVFQWRGNTHLCTSNCKVADIQALLDLTSGSILLQYRMYVATGFANEGLGSSGIRGVALDEYLQWTPGFLTNVDPFTALPMPSNVCFFQTGASCGTSLANDPVPEPSSFLLVASGACVMAWRRWRR